MYISTDLAKKIWKDDPEMLKIIEGWERISCILKIDDDDVMTLYPMSVEGNGGPGVASHSGIDAKPIGKPAEVPFFIGIPEEHVEGLLVGRE